MTHHEKMAVARLLKSLHQQDCARTDEEGAAALVEVRAAIDGCLPLVRGHETVWRGHDPKMTWETA